MKLFARAVVTGFALAMGSALFKKIAKQIGLDDDGTKAKSDKDTDQEAVNRGDGATDPGLHSYS
jgi:hypothetical protein